MDELRGLWRGKGKESGKWIIGDLRYIADLDGSYYPCIVDNSCGRNNSVCGVPVDPSTLGECIRRRDRNGKPVFEGDVLRWSSVFHDSEKAYSGSFAHSESYLILVGKQLLENGITDMVSGNGNMLGTVYGNIYDNPELSKLFTVDGIDKKGNK